MNYKPYADIIRTALPENILDFISNIDDIFCGWEICPKPSVLITFDYQIDNVDYIRIKIFKINYYSGVKSTITEKKIYNGQIPSNENGPDFNFIEQILKNWLNFIS